ncbi:site-specific integrase [Mesorhizobium sp. M0309]|uniref:tyrosine-type recombinase/integrase n=1 Tax=Mesorhizobium sp. M0309 TaxID=2956933 RepID=UPI00333710C5
MQSELSVGSQAHEGQLNAANERLKHRYFAWLRDAKGLGEHSIDQVAKALDRFERYTRRRSFKEFRTEQASGFKKHLAIQDGKRTGTRLSKATLTSTLHAMRDFVEWLADQKGFRNRLVKTDALYFKPSRQDEAISRAPRQMDVPTIEQIRMMMSAMPQRSIVERRNRAIVALIILTGARDDAAASARLKHLDVSKRELFQDARQMRTKFRKTFSTWFFPVGDDFAAVIEQWKTELQSIHGFGADAPLFPRTVVSFSGDGSVTPPRIGTECWANADPVRKLFKEACKSAGLPNFKPHSFRHTLARLGQRMCITPEELKAWSQNLGHEDVLTTLTSYGTVPGYRQQELMAGICERTSAATGH